MRSKLKPKYICLIIPLLLLVLFFNSGSPPPPEPPVLKPEPRPLTLQEQLQATKKQLVEANRISSTFPFEQTVQRLMDRDSTLTRQFYKAKMFAEEPEQDWFSLLDEFDPQLLQSVQAPVPPTRETKYFQEHAEEATLYKGDARYFKSLPESDIIPTLKNLFTVWTTLAARHDVTFWIAHGALLGWFWNQQILPWDDDLDLQMPLSSLVKLLELNQTLIDDRYLLDVNPFAIYGRDKVWRSSRSPPNKIDARFIDTQNGLYIDLTALHLTPKSIKLCRGADRAKCDFKVACKTPHYYSVKDLYPLSITKFEDTITWRPHHTVLLLKEEYGEKSMIAELFKQYYFLKSTNEWKKLPPTSHASNTMYGIHVGME